MNSRVNMIRQWLNTSQRKAISLGTLTALLVAILIWGSFRPTAVAITEVLTKNKDGKALLQELTTKNTNLSNLIEQQQQLNDDLTSLNNYFPVDSNFSLFIANLDAGAKRNNFTLDSVQFSEKRTTQAKKDALFSFSKLDPVSFDITLFGEPGNVQSFLNFLNSLPYGVRITDVSYAEGRNSNTTSISVRIIVYKLAVEVTDE